MREVINMSKKTNNGQVRSPKQMLQELVDLCDEDGNLESRDKVLVIALNDKGAYAISWHQAGMKMSECVTLCEVGKTSFLEEMGYLTSQ